MIGKPNCKLKKNQGKPICKIKKSVDKKIGNGNLIKGMSSLDIIAILLLLGGGVYLGYMALTAVLKIAMKIVLGAIGVAAIYSFFKLVFGKKRGKKRK